MPGWWYGVPVLSDMAAATGMDLAVYPGSWALLPTLGTALVIWAGAGAWLNRVVLAQRALVYLGLFSYPLYLWHWPLLSLLMITENGHPPPALRAAAVGMSFVLAWLTYVLVEQPIRRGVSVRTPLRVAALVMVMAAIGSAALVASRTGGVTSRVPFSVTAQEKPIASPRHDPACHARFPTDGEYCQESAPGNTLTTALVGDSHAEHFLNGLGAYFAQRGESVVHLGESGCPPLLDIERFPVGSHDTCRAPGNSVIRFVGDTPAITRVILSLRGTVDVSGRGFGRDAVSPVVFRVAGTNLPPDESMRRALGRTVDYLVEKRKQVWLLLQIPELGFHVQECVGRPFSFSSRLRTPCDVPKDQVAGRQALYRQIVADVAASRPAFHVFDPLPYLCDQQSCHAIVDRQLLYNDDNHLSPAGSLFFVDKFAF